MKEIIVIIGLLLAFSVPSFASNLEFGPDGKPSQKLLDEAAAENDKIVNEIYAKEGGKRDKSLILKERLANLTLSAFMNNSFEYVNKNDNESVHISVGAAMLFLKNDFSNININQGTLAALHYIDGQAYMADGDILPALEAYKKSISYRESAPAYFQLGLMYMMNNDVNNGDKNFKTAVNMDKELKPKYEEAIAHFKQKGIIK